MILSEIRTRISVIDGEERFSIPDWAASMVWLGAWCRSSQLPGKRLVVFAVLPTRELTATFAGLGSLIGGGGVFEDVLTWQTFKKLPAGRVVYLIRRDTGMRYSGKIIGFEDCDGTEFIVVKITDSSKSKKSTIGSILRINQKYFDRYRSTEDKPPSVSKTASLDAAGSAFDSLIENLNPKWIWSDGTEGLLVTSVTTFDRTIKNLSLLINGKQSIALSDILCLARNKDVSHAKLRFEHPRGSLDGVFPLAILDGPKAFEVHEHLCTVRNLLVILDRSEYQSSIHDTALQLIPISQDISPEFKRSIPERFAPGIELAAYLIDGP